MGLLDDAIREHLDLKRRRGADPTDIERAEREALGPVRRGPELTGEEPAPPEASGEAQADYPEAPPEQWEPFHEDPELRQLEEPEEFPPYEPPHAPDGDPLMDDAAHEEPHGALEQESLQPPPAAEPEPRPAPHPADPPPAYDDEPLSRVEQETEEYELEPEADDDVLESTPEFLQDAPEHDRLWFEQRPPRDFDFDG